MTADELAQIRTEVRLGTLEGMKEHLDQDHKPLWEKVNGLQSDAKAVKIVGSIVALGFAGFEAIATYLKGK